MRKDKEYWFDLGNRKKARLEFEVDRWFTSVIEDGISCDNSFKTEVEALREILSYCEVDE